MTEKHKDGPLLGRRTLLKTFAGGAALGILAACSPEDIKAQPQPIESATPGPANPGVNETEAPEPEIDFDNIETYELRHEPFSDGEVAWSYVREKLDELGSVPQSADPAYELYDRLAASTGDNLMGAEDFTQLNHNLKVAMNLLLANRDKFPDESVEQARLIRSTMQDVILNISEGSERYAIVYDSLLIEWMLERLDRVSPGGVVKSYEITKYNHDHNNFEEGGIYITMTYITNPETGGFYTEEFHDLGQIVMAPEINPASYSGGYNSYDPAHDYNSRVEIGIY